MWRQRPGVSSAVAAVRGTHRLSSITRAGKGVFFVCVFAVAVVPALLTAPLPAARAPALHDRPGATAANGTVPVYPEDWIPRSSTWTDARHGWTWPPDSRLVATSDGGRSWNVIFSGANYLFNPGYVRTSRSAGLVATGRIGGGVFWTNDGGRRWFGVRGAAPLQSAAAGRGSLLFWHSYTESPDTLYRVTGWPPRGDFPCLPRDWPPNQPPGHRVCAELPDDAGMRSVPVARLDHGTLGEMRPVPGGVAALVADPRRPLAGLDATAVAVYRVRTLSLARLPAPALKSGEIFSGRAELAAAGPSLFATVPLSLPNDPYRPRRIGSVLWRSGDGGKSWTVRVSRTLPKRFARARGRARIGARVWLPGGFVASAHSGAKKMLMIRQLGRTRLLALPGSGHCSALSPRVDWPFLAVEGRRRGSTPSIWWSANGGSHWTRFGRC